MMRDRYTEEIVRVAPAREKMIATYLYGHVKTIRALSDNSGSTEIEEG